MGRIRWPTFLAGRPSIAKAPPEDQLYKERVLHRTLAVPVGSDYTQDLETRFLHSFLSSRSVFVDVGANAGAYAAVVEQIVGSRSMVLVEPLPRLAEVLCARFPSSHVIAAAVSDRRGRATIRVPSIDGKTYTTRATLNDHDEPGQSGFEEMDVEVRTLDDLVAELRLRRIDVLKVDVEGHELELVAGGLGTIRRLRPIVLIEIEARHHTFPLAGVFTELEAAGLEGWVFDPRTMKVRRARDLDPAVDQDIAHLESRDFIRYLNNFWFVPTERVDRFLERATHFLDGLEPLDGPPGRSGG
jgi:FkbM family methyltransferase